MTHCVTHLSVCGRIFAFYLNIILMRRSLDLIGGALFVIWIVEYFGYNAGENAHVLLLAAIVIFFVKIFVYLPSKGKS